MTMLNPCDLEIVTGGVLDNDYIDYLTRVMFYAKRADKTLDQVLSDLRNHGCTQEALHTGAASSHGSGSPSLRSAQTVGIDFL